MKNPIKTHLQKRSVGRLFACLMMILFLCPSCYTVRLKTVNGVGMPDPMSQREDYFRDLLVFEKDTVVSIGAVNKNFTMLIKECPNAGLHTIEYRNTFGGVLLSAVTLGRKRRVKIKYVCIKS